MNRQEVAAWVQAAQEDGWSVRPTYRNESVKQAAKLQKDGWEAAIISRPQSRMLIEHADITVWGPDGLQVLVNTPYSWDALVAGLRTCGSCGATDVETTQYYFAGRVCLGCRKVLKEEPGWTR